MAPKVRPVHRFLIYRYILDSGVAPHMQSYEIEVGDAERMLLDVLLKLKAIDPSLSFRRSCREGMCGSDAININGKNGLACACGPGTTPNRQKTMTALNCKVGDLAIVICANIPENIGNIVEIVGPPTGHPIKASWECATWHVRTISGRRTLVYRLGNGSIGIVKRHAEGPVPDFRLRPFPGIQVVYEQGRAGERDIAEGMFTPAETLETDEVGTDRAIRVDVLR